MATQLQASKGPIVKTRVGRFQISIWKRRTIRPARFGFIPERESDEVRACVQYAVFNTKTRQWVNQSIWCDPHELRDLVNVLDQLNENNGGA